jgi:hypothetical protein
MRTLCVVSAEVSSFRDLIHLSLVHVPHLSSPDRLVRCLSGGCIFPTPCDSRRPRQERTQWHKPPNPTLCPSIYRVCSPFMGHRDVALPLSRRNAAARHVVIHEVSLPRFGEVEVSEDLTVAQHMSMQPNLTPDDDDLDSSEMRRGEGSW